MFNWNKRFEIGNSTIDKEHQKLFELLNTLAEDIEEGHKEEAELESSLVYLLSYARQHFADEEKVMEHFKVDQRHINIQLMEHSSFMHDVRKLRDRGEGMSTDERYEKIVSFITSWLVFHTLSTDQYLGIQLKAIKQGMSPEEAYTQSREAKLDAIFYRYVIKALVHLWTDAAGNLLKLEKQLDTLSTKRDDDFDQFFADEMHHAHNPDVLE